MFGIRYVGHIFFLVYAALSVYYATERIVFIDSAKYLFDLINNESLLITGRAGGYPVLLLPLLCIKLKLSLYIVIVAFSLSYVLVFYLIFILIVYVLKADKAAWLFLFSLLLCTRDTFYYPATEVYLGMAYVCLFYAILFSEVIKYKFISYLLVALLVFICSITHPVLILLLIPVLLFKFFESENNLEKWVISAISISAFFLFSLKPFTSNNLNAIEGAGYKKAFSFFSYLPDVFSFPSANFFYIHIWQSTSIYLMGLAAFVISILYYLFTKQFWKFSVIFISAAALWLLTVIVYSEGESAMVLGKSFAPLAFIFSLPFFHDILFEKKKWFNYSIMFLLSAVLFLKYRDIALIGKHQKERINNLTENVNNARERGIYKAIVSYENVVGKDNLIHWAYSIESVLISSFDEAEQSVSIFIEDKKRMSLSEEILKSKNTFLYIQSEITLPLEKLNSHYFRLPEKEYVYLK